MKTASRTLNTKRNIIYSYIYALVSFIFQFVSRSLIVRILGSQYLGLSSLFTSILQVLSMADLGFSAAIIYNMYKPIAENDTESVCALLRFYKQIYLTVAVIILIVGLALAPFLHVFIKGSYPSDVNLYVLYVLYLINTVSSYIFFAYKTALLNAVQRLDLSKIAYIIASLIQYAGQIIALTVFRSYYGFVMWLIIGTIGKNILTAFITDKYFPEYQCRGSITPAVKRDITARVKGLLICSISSVTYTTLDSIILSSFVGLKSVAVYNNYMLIYTGVGTFIAMIRIAMQASVGNSVALESPEKNYRDMLLWQFLFASISVWCTTCMFCLYQPFMKFWMGEDMLLSHTDVTLICLWFFFGLIQHSYFLYLAGTGAWWEMRWPYIMSTVTNLILNIVLGKLLDVTGIILASLISSFIFGLVWQCNIIFRTYFCRNTIQFYKRLAFYFVICVLSIAISEIIIESITPAALPALFNLVLRGIICTIIVVLIQYSVYNTLTFSREELRHAKILFKKK